MTATIYIVGWDGATVRHADRATIPAMTAKHLADYFSTRLASAGTHGVFLDSKGMIVLEWGWKTGHKEIRNIPPYVPGWEIFASRAKLAEFKRRGY